MRSNFMGSSVSKLEQIKDQLIKNHNFLYLRFRWVKPLPTSVGNNRCKIKPLEVMPIDLRPKPLKLFKLSRVRVMQVKTSDWKGSRIMSIIPLRTVGSPPVRR